MIPNHKIAVFSNLDCGGAKRAIYEFIKFLSKRHVIDLYNLSITKEEILDLRKMVRNTYTFKYKILSIKRPFGFLNRFIVFLNQYRLNTVYRKMAKVINQRNYDVVFAQQSFSNVPVLLKYLQIPSIYYCQEPYRRLYEPYITQSRFAVPFSKMIYNIFFLPISKLYEYYLKVTDRRNIKYAKLVLCNSFFSRGYIHKTYGVLAEVNYLGADIETFKPIGTPKENLVISVGHLEPRKAHDFVIKAIAYIPPQQRPKLAIAYYTWSYGEKEYLKNLAEDNRVEVSFLENLSDEELNILYNKAKVTACAYIMEPFGLVPLESMACQTPVVTIREAGPKESVIHNQTGILTERNIDEFSQAIEYLLKNEQIRIQMGEAGRKYVLENWTWEKSVQELEGNLLKVLKINENTSD